MADIISFQNYYDIAYYYNDASDVIQSALSYTEDAVNNIVALNDLYPELDLLQGFWDSYLFTANSIDSTTAFMSGTSALQAHIMARGSASSVAAWWEAEKSAVAGAGDPPQSWKDLSSSAGYPYE